MSIVARTLHELNAPLLEALERQRQLVADLEDAAQGLAILAASVDQMAHQYAEITDRTAAAFGPYLRYVDWLRDVGGVSSG